MERVPLKQTKNNWKISQILQQFVKMLGVRRIVDLMDQINLLFKISLNLVLLKFAVSIYYKREYQCTLNISVVIDVDRCLQKNPLTSWHYCEI